MANNKEPRTIEVSGGGGGARSTIILFLLALTIIGFVFGVSRWIRSQANDDLKGVITQTSPGVVTALQLAPGHSGGAGYFNAVTVTFAGHNAFYTLPETSRWNPKDGDKVTVTYRIGRHSGLPKIDFVTAIDPPINAIK